MNNDLQKLCKELTEAIKKAYEGGISMDEAERLAAKFLYGQIQVAEELQALDLDARMRKSGLKAVQASVRMSEIQKHDKKPTESQLLDVVNLDDNVVKSQEELDVAEVKREALENYLMIFKDGHIYFRGVAKGRFE